MQRMLGCAFVASCAQAAALVLSLYLRIGARFIGGSTLVMRNAINQGSAKGGGDNGFAVGVNRCLMRG